jgi:hypothetical protein
VDDNFLSGQGHFSTSLTENMGHVTLFECIPTKYMELHKHSRQCSLSTYEIVYLERERDGEREWENRVYVYIATCNLCIIWFNVQWMYFGGTMCVLFLTHRKT